MLTFGSLFTGIGGIDLGFERAGMTCMWQVEINIACQRVLKKHWPNVPLYGDIKEVDFGAIEPVDVICGGFPCQPVSLVGPRQGQEDSRWLWPEFSRAVSVIRPRYVAIENVPGLLAAGKRGRSGIADVLEDLASLGYDAEWQVLSAAQFGAIHLRERLFLVAYASCSPEWVSRRQQRAVPVSATRNTWMDDCGSSPRYVFPESNPIQGRGSPGVGFPEWRCIEPFLHRGDHGFSARVDRYAGCGNSVVPQCAEFVGRLIVRHAA